MVPIDPIDTRRLALDLSTLLGRRSVKEVITDLLNVLGGRVGVGGGMPDFFNQIFWVVGG
jgi:hypothetical protein